MNSPADSAASDAAAADAAAWVEKLQGAVEAAAAEARGAFFYYAGFGLYFALAVAGTSHEDLLRGSTVSMPGLGIGLPVVGFYAVVPALFVVFHVYVLLQLVILARRIGWLKLALKRRRGATALRQHVLVSPFAISQRLLGEPQGWLPQLLLRLSIWLTLVLIPLGLLLATQLRFLPYHAAGVTWAHRLYIVLDALIVLFLWPAIIHPEGRGALGWLSTVVRRMTMRRRGLAARLQAGAEALRRRGVWRRRTHAAGGPLHTFDALARLGLALAVIFVAFVVATIPGEAFERGLLAFSRPVERADCSAAWRVDRWLNSVRLPDRRNLLCVTYRFFEAPETPLGLRRNMVVRGASLVVVEPTQEQIAALGVEEAWKSQGKGVDLINRDLRFADMSGSDLRRADLRGANLNGAVLEDAKLVAAKVRDTPRIEVGPCAYEEDELTDTCLSGLIAADLTNADLRFLEGWKIDLRGANLTAAKLEGADLKNGQLDATLLPWADLREAQLDDADLEGAILREVTAQNVTLGRADLAYALVRQVDVDIPKLQPRRLEGTGLALEPPSEPGWRRSLEYEMAPQVALQTELALTANLFRRACQKGPPKENEIDEEKAIEALALRARGVIQRVWHEFDYGRNHDPEGYAPVADLRYLLAKAMLDPDLCRGAEWLAEHDVCTLQRFLSEWRAWRKPRQGDPDKPVEPDLASSWNDLRRRIGLAGASGDQAGGVVLQTADAGGKPGDRQRCSVP
jgi:uncharacterized protein YjbI with pentapeptide repeats